MNAYQFVVVILSCLVLRVGCKIWLYLFVIGTFVFDLNGKGSLRLLQWCPKDIAGLCDENTGFYDLIKLFV